MNWSDLIVVAIILGFGLIGLSKGFIYSMFRLASFLVASIISVKCYPLLAKILVKTQIFTNIREGIKHNLMLQQQVQSPAANDVAKEAANVTAQGVIDNLQLPGFLKDMISNNLVEGMKNAAASVNVTTIIEKISDVLAHMVIDILSLILLYIIIRIGLIFLRFILAGISKLPIFKQMDKLGGFAFGALEGLLTIYIVFAVLMLFHSSPQFKVFFDAVDNSAVAKFFYQNNFIIDWMFPKNTIV